MSTCLKSIVITIFLLSSLSAIAGNTDFWSTIVGQCLHKNETFKKSLNFNDKKNFSQKIIFADNYTGSGNILFEYLGENDSGVPIKTGDKFKVYIDKNNIMRKIIIMNKDEEVKNIYTNWDTKNEDSAESNIAVLQNIENSLKLLPNQLSKIVKQLDSGAGSNIATLKSIETSINTLSSQLPGIIKQLDITNKILQVHFNLNDFQINR